MKPWNFDAGSLVYNLNLKENLYLNSKISKYLNIGNHDHMFMLSGPKGIGKTLFINVKSLLYRESAESNGFSLYPANQQLCENLNINNDILSKEDLLKFSSYDSWKKIWSFTLSIIAANTYGISLPEEINEKFNKNDTCSSIITALLQDRKNLTTTLSQLPKLLRCLQEITNGVAIFIDNVDQAFRQFLMEYHHSDYEGDINPSVKFWTNAQNGLLSSMYDLNRSNSHIKIFATIRSEALNAYQGEMALNFKNYCTNLVYSKEEIKKIYELNISLMDDEDFIIKSSKNPSEKFFGFSKMGHPFAKTNSNRKKTENTFDFIYRHTFGRPREIVYMGSILYDKLNCSTSYRTLQKNKQIEKLRWKVNEVSEELLKQYLKEVVPRFNKSELIDFLNIVQSNVISSIFVKDEVKEKMRYLYSLGILGVVKKKNHSSKNNVYVQKFLEASQYTYDEEIQLPKSKYYVTHPTLDGKLKDLFDLSFYNKVNIIGNDYDFLDTDSITRTYDVALSFAGENRDYVEKVATYLKFKGVGVFYDKYFETTLWGKDLYQHLNTIYRELANTCVVFISEHYPKKFWTKHELKAVQSRSFTEGDDYLLPIRFDDTKINGLNNTVGFIDANFHSPEEIAEKIIEKINTLSNKM